MKNRSAEKTFFSPRDGRKSCAYRWNKCLKTVDQPASDAIIFSIWKGKACGFGVSFGKLERLTGYAILWGLRRMHHTFFIMITEYISGFHLAFSRRCENRVFTADIQVGDE